MLGALPRWVEVSKYMVSKHSYISLLLPSPTILSIDTVYRAERPIVIITNVCSC
jgi:hypothetical protein